jgi:hypothetical protein
MKNRLLLGIAMLLLLSACASAATATAIPTPAATVTPILSAAPMDSYVTQVVANGKVTYRDDNSDVTLEYPEGWLIDLTAGGTRGVYVYLITSLDFIPGMRSEIPEGATLVFVTIAKWEKANDLTAFVEFQKQGWQTSGDTIVSEEDRSTPAGDPVKYVVSDTRDGRNHIFIKTVGRRYAIISGYGNLDALWAIAVSVR